MKNSAKRARAEAWTTKTKHSRGKTLHRNRIKILEQHYKRSSESFVTKKRLKFEKQSKKCDLFLFNTDLYGAA